MLPLLMWAERRCFRSMSSSKASPSLRGTLLRLPSSYSLRSVDGRILLSPLRLDMASDSARALLIMVGS